jgi:hypothetical protein
MAAAASLGRHVLPKDLPGAIKQLDDQELDRLFAAVVAEQKRRGKKTPAPIETPFAAPDAAVVHLAPGKMNAVRAAFKAGVKPSQIARQFGLSQSGGKLKVMGTSSISLPAARITVSVSLILSSACGRSRSLCRLGILRSRACINMQ